MSAGEQTEGAGSDPARQVHEEATVVPGFGGRSGSAQPGTGQSAAVGDGADLREFSRALIEIGLIDEAELESYAADSAEGVLGFRARWSRPASSRPTRPPPSIRRKAAGS